MGIRRALEEHMSSMVNALFPPLCIHCNKDGAYVCSDCIDSILWIDPYWACRMCGAPFGRFTCTCCKHQGDFKGCICAVGSGEISLKIVKTYKNGPEINLAPFMAAAIVSVLEIAELEGILPVKLCNIDAISYIPARSDAFIKRGFDHMELVSRIVSRLLNIPLARVLEVGEVEDQRALDKKQRLENMEDSIHVIQNVSGLNILLIDDVVTTGATLLSAQRALEQAGALHVIPSAFCRVW